MLTMIRVLPILIVEDSPEDFETIMRALKSESFPNPIVHCSDGDEALDYLFPENVDAEEFAGRRPAIVLLDLNLPGTTGHEVLARMKGDAFLKKIPVIVFTSSNNEADVTECYAAGANSYLQKPVDFMRYKSTLQHMVKHWLQDVTLPE